ncbi:hypothetical protein ACT7C8_01575 [Bacillus cereus]
MADIVSQLLDMMINKDAGFVKIAGVNNGAKKDFSELLTESVALIVGQIMGSMEL